MNRHIASKGEMQLVGLVSDTHMPSGAATLPQMVLEIFNEASLIIHAGDLVDLDVVKGLEEIAPVLAVHGNADPEGVRGLFPELNSTRIFNWKIGVVHDVGIFWGKAKMRRIAEENGFDVLVFGHRHRPFLEAGPIIFINPGSPTIPLPPYFVKPSVGVLEVARNRIESSIVEL